MNIVYLISVIFGVSAQNVIKKPYTQKTGNSGVFFFSALTSLAALIFFVLTGGNWSFDAAILWYSAGFAVSYALATVFMISAIAVGSLSLTSLITSYSLMIPTFYGLLFLNDPVSFGLIPGLVLLVISLLLINKPSADAPITWKWLLFVFLSFVGNGMCSTVQKMQQIAFNEAYKNEFMIAALAMVTVLMAALSLVKERSHIVHNAKCGWHLALICGLLNGMVNLFVMLLQGLMPMSLMFPLISAGGIIVTGIVSIAVYKEKLTAWQYVGFVLGIGAVVFLNL